MATSGTRLDQAPSKKELLVLSVAKASAPVGLVSGAAGLTVGGAAGLFRSATPGLFALASGVQCFSLGFTFAASRTATLLAVSHSRLTPVDDLSSSDRRISSTVGGAFAGATTAALFRGRPNVIPGLLVWSAVGFGGQVLVDVISPTASRQSDERSRPGFIERIAASKWSPMTKLSDEQYANIQREKLLRIEAEIATIDDDIAKLNSQSHHRDEPKG